MVHIFFLFFYCLYGDGEFTAVEAAMSTMQLSMPTLVHWERFAFINCICVRMRSGNSVRRRSMLCAYAITKRPMHRKPYYCWRLVPLAVISTIRTRRNAGSRCPLWLNTFSMAPSPIGSRRFSLPARESHIMTVHRMRRQSMSCVGILILLTCTRLAQSIDIACNHCASSRLRHRTSIN